MLHWSGMALLGTARWHSIAMLGPATTGHALAMPNVMSCRVARMAIYIIILADIARKTGPNGRRMSTWMLILTMSIFEVVILQSSAFGTTII